MSEFSQDHGFFGRAVQRFMAASLEEATRDMEPELRQHVFLSVTQSIQERNRVYPRAFVNLWNTLTQEKSDA